MQTEGSVAADKHTTTRFYFDDSFTKKSPVYFAFESKVQLFFCCTTSCPSTQSFVAAAQKLLPYRNTEGRLREAVDAEARQRHCAVLQFAYSTSIA